MMDGIQGPLISRSPTPDPHADEYDEDIISHTMYIQDWMHVLTDVKLPGYNKALQEDGFDHVNNYLINGRGSYTVSSMASLINTSFPNIFTRTIIGIK